MKKLTITLILILLSACNQQTSNITIQPSIKPSEIKLTASPVVNEITSVQPTSSILPNNIVASEIPSLLTSASPTVNTNIPVYTPTPTSVILPSLVPVSVAPSNPYINYKYVYKRIDPLPAYFNTAGGVVELSFNEEYKIRYSSAEKKFISLNGTDITSINELLIYDKLVNVNGLYELSVPEEKTQKIEDFDSEACKCNYRNPLSLQVFAIQGVVINDFITTLRNNPLVREANLAHDENSDTLMAGAIYLSFNAEIKYNKEKNKFISLNGQDVTDINELFLSKYEAHYSDDEGSYRGFFVKGVKIKDLIRMLKMNPVVNEVNLFYPGKFSGGGGAG